MPPWASLRLSLRRRFLGMGKPKTADAWDRQYRSGSWERLEENRELARYAVVAALVRRFAPAGARIVDIGCGVGILAEHIAAPGTSYRYDGVDLSSEAIARANAERGQLGRFRVGDAERPRLEDGEQFDVLVFNEVLNYFGDPLAAVGRWVSRLDPGGVVVISLWKPSRHRAMDRRLRRRLRRRLAVTIGADDGGAPWRVSVEDPVRGDSAGQSVGWVAEPSEGGGT